VFATATARVITTMQASTSHPTGTLFSSSSSSSLLTDHDLHLDHHLDADLPSYTPSKCPPSYSSSPSQGEHRVQYASRGPSSSLVLRGHPGGTPTGIYTAKKNNIALVLTEQEDGTSIPTYSGLLPISGTISLDGREGVTEVWIALQGVLSASIQGRIGGSESLEIVNKRVSLWSLDERQTHGTKPPSSIPFSIPIPATFTDITGQTGRPLPPSHDISFNSEPGLTSKAKYTLTIGLTKRRKFPASMKSTHTLKVKISYLPRRRPNLPMLSCPSLLGTVKTSPEEWHQTTEEMTLRAQRGGQTEGIAPIYSTLFIPSVQVFGFTDKIPFHLQLSGSLRSMRELVHLTSSASSPLSGETIKMPNIRVTLQRDVIVGVYPTRAFKSTIIGEGNLTALPPNVDLVDSESLGGGQLSLDFEGTIQPSSASSQKLTYGGFFTGSVSVKDWIVVSVIPQNSHKSRWLPLRSATAVRLVTDSYSEAEVGA
jgi:hypothetical protein